MSPPWFPVLDKINPPKIQIFFYNVNVKLKIYVIRIIRKDHLFSAWASPRKNVNKWVLNNPYQVFFTKLHLADWDYWQSGGLPLVSKHRWDHFWSTHLETPFNIITEYLFFGILTACKVKMASLLVQWKPCEKHRTCTLEWGPHDNIQDKILIRFLKCHLML